MTTSEVPIEGVGLRFASACVRTLGGTGRSLLALVSEFMRERDVPTLRCLHAALMDPANAKHAEFWSGLNISVALASWLGDPDDACRQLANDWIRDLKGTPEHAQHALLEALSERDQPVDAVRARRLADLSLTKATQSQLEDFLPSLWTALVCDTGTNDKPVDPGRIALLTHLLGKRLLATPSLILLASALPSPEWLAAVVTFHRDAPSVLHSAGREAMKNMLALAAQERPNWLLRVAHAGATHGWIDAQMGNELLGLPCKGNPSAYGGALAHQSAFPAGGEKALHTIKALHAAGADLDTVAKIDDAILVGRSVQEAQKFVYPLTWKGTLLHAAVVRGPIGLPVPA